MQTSDSVRFKYGELMAVASCFACLGRPLLLSRNEDPVAVKTRKALAIMGYLSRVNSMSSPREMLSDLLWSKAERTKAMQSLRQALRQLKTAEDEAGFDVVRTSTGHVRLDPETFSSDLMTVLTLLERGRADDFREAEGLWRGDFLAGFEDIDPEFSDWLQVERERVRSDVVTAAFKHLDQISTVDGGLQVEAGGRFLLKIDPALESAHRILIRLYMKLGQRERAEQQFKACEREMRLHLDAEPDEETHDILVDKETESAVFRRPAEIGPTVVSLANSRNSIQLPEISILSSSVAKSGLNDAIYMREEIVSGLSSFRSYNLYQSEYFGEENAPMPTLIEGHELGSYLLRFRHDERSGKVVVQFEDRENGQIIFNEIVDISMWDGIVPAAGHIVNRIHTHSISKLQNPSNTATFARWCQAEALLWDFTPSSDDKAMQILNDLERTNSAFSMTYAGKASIAIKQELHFPLYDKKIASNVSTGPLALAERAIMLDPWQAFNLRAYGWATIISDMPDEARRAFRNASRLSSADPTNLMSVAEGLAYSGDVEEARLIADRAFSLCTFVPRAFYEYLANIYFAADDYENSIRQIERCSGVGISGLTTRVASLICINREEEALQILQRYSEHRAQLLKSSPVGTEDLTLWRKRINFFQDETTRRNFDRGAAFVQRFLYEGTGSV
ncbi:BTAD domain-containing putative transcriptional regulator [Roseibium album]|uniref:BTAD domain-containing putative transcriptional regulator n=1 Tax=Roseibium album TaxID=311410 RepID=UPI003296F5CF